MEKYSATSHSENPTSGSTTSKVSSDGFKPIPPYLQQFIVKQEYDQYTPIDHATWRFILRVSAIYFKDHAHEKYLKGLEETGISIDRIPRIEEMNDKLMQFGWRAVAVSGFIVPAAFMEFQALGVLPIACDMRKLENLAYTPAPDIVHEAAGHAPIIADPEYAQYLLNYGEVSRKAIFSNQDIKIYEAIRDLSEVKEDPKSTPEEIKQSQKNLNKAISAVDYVSEAAILARMNWWTTEYGLVGKIDRPKIYGAGLLSSVGESQNCLKDDVLKVPLTIDCLNTSYDITRPQPQLFVAQNFHVLSEVLDEMADQMAFRKGGLEGLAKAMKAQNVTTTELDSGLQISGKLVKIISDSRNTPCFLKFEGPTQLSYESSEIEGQGCELHEHGYSTPIGFLKNSHQSPADLKKEDLENLGFKGKQKGSLKFESGIEVKGVLKKCLNQDDKNLLFTFTDCEVTYLGEVLFDPSWGQFDMACGIYALSVYGGAADRAKYLAATGGFNHHPRSQKTNFDAKEEPLYSLYSRVRQMREDKIDDANQAEVILKELDQIKSDDWLCRIEILELCHRFQWKTNWCDETKQKLSQIAQSDAQIGFLIQRGLEAIESDLL